MVASVLLELCGGWIFQKDCPRRAEKKVYHLLWLNIWNHTVSLITGSPCNSTYYWLKQSQTASFQGRKHRKLSFKGISMKKFVAISYKLQISLVALRVKNLSVMPETWVWSLGWEDPLEKEMATHSCLENSMNRGGWWATVHQPTKNRTWLKDLLI